MIPRHRNTSRLEVQGTRICSGLHQLHEAEAPENLDSWGGLRNGSAI